METKNNNVLLSFLEAFIHVVNWYINIFVLEIQPTSYKPLAKGNNLCNTCIADSTLDKNGSQQRTNVAITANPIFINLKNLQKTTMKELKNNLIICYLNEKNVSTGSFSLNKCWQNL